MSSSLSSSSSSSSSSLISLSTITSTCTDSDKNNFIFTYTTCFGKKLQPILDNYERNTIIQEIENCGFDLKKNINDNQPVPEFSVWGARPMSVTPMIFFCQDFERYFKICKFLKHLGASCTQSSSDGYWYPWKVAAYQQDVDLCKWLYNDSNAAEDINKVHRYGTTPLSESLSFGRSCLSTSKWFLLNGDDNN